MRKIKIGFLFALIFMISFVSSTTTQPFLHTDLNTENVSNGNSYLHLNVTTENFWNNLKLYLPFDVDNKSETGTTAHDLSNQGLDGTLQNEAYINDTDCFSGSCSFHDGESDYAEADRIDFPSNSILSANHTVMMWIKPTNLDANAGLLDFDTGYSYVRLFSDGDMYLIFYNTTSSYASCRSSTPIAVGEWSHIAYTTWFNGTHLVQDIFVNGTSTGAGDCSQISTDGVWQFDGLDYFGRAGATTEAFNGSIDEFMVFNTDLSEANISSIYQNSSERFYKSGSANLPTTNTCQIDVGTTWANLTVNFSSFEGSVVNGSIGYYNGSWGWTAPKNLTSGVGEGFIIPANAENITFNLSLYTDSNGFFTPLIVEGISLTFEEYLNPSQVEDICDEGTLSLSDAVSLTGIIMTILFLSAVVALLVATFSGYVDLGEVKSESINLENVLRGVLVLGVTFLIIATMVYLLGSAYCGALT